MKIGFRVGRFGRIANPSYVRLAVKVLVWSILIVLNVPLLIGLGWLFFGTWQKFLLTLLSALSSMIGALVSENTNSDEVTHPIWLVVFAFTYAAFAYVQYLMLSWLGIDI